MKHNYTTTETKTASTTKFWNIKGLEIEMIITVLVVLALLFLPFFSHASCDVTIPELSVNEGCIEMEFMPYADNGEVEYMWATNVDGWIFPITGWTTELEAYCPETPGYYRICARKTDCYFWIEESSDVYVGDCSAYELTPRTKIGGQSWSTGATSITSCEGDRVVLDFQGNDYAGWTFEWTGPNNFYDYKTGNNNDKLRLNNITAAEAGTYDVTYTTDNGCTFTESFEVTVAVIPTLSCFTRTASTDWAESTSLNLEEGQDAYLGINDLGTEGLTIDGPNGYRSEQPMGGSYFMIGSCNMMNAGTYTITYTNEGGCEVSTDFNLSVAPASFLPVELAFFNVNFNKEDVLINWATETELDNEYFEVERSKDGKSWEVIELIEGAGTTTEVQNYNTIDKAPLAGTSYYRLKQTDFDGTFTYSDIKSINNENELAIETNIFPNPVSEILNIESNQDLANSNITLFNSNGTAVQTQNTTNGTKAQLNVSTLASGNYFLAINNGNETITTAVIIK